MGWDINVRELQHMNKNKKNNSSVKEHIDRTNSTYELKKITDEPVNLIEAGKLENETIDQYRENGWVILNKIRGGSIGGGIRKWTYNNCKNKSVECKTRHEFQKNSQVHMILLWITGGYMSYFRNLKKNANLMGIIRMKCVVN